VKDFFIFLATIILTPIVLLIIFSAVRQFKCGPDEEVVRVASPVARIIADDIVKNGIPASLKDIEGLPYKLEGCVREEIYKDKDRKVSSKENAYSAIIEEECYFYEKNNKYNLWSWFQIIHKEKNEIHGTFHIKKEHTYVSRNFSFSEKNGLFYTKSVSASPHGIICSSFKQ